MGLFNYIENTDYSSLITDESDNQEIYEITDTIAISYMTDGNNEDDSISSGEGTIIIESDSSESYFDNEQYETIISYYDDFNSELESISNNISSINIFVIILGCYCISNFIFSKLKIRKEGDL